MSTANELARAGEEGLALVDKLSDVCTRRYKSCAPFSPSFISAAHAVILMSTVKGGLGVGYAGGHGIALVKLPATGPEAVTAQEWSAPLFLSLGVAELGICLGFERVDTFMLAMARASLRGWPGKGCCLPGRAHPLQSAPLPLRTAPPLCLAIAQMFSPEQGDKLLNKLLQGSRAVLGVDQSLVVFQPQMEKKSDVVAVSGGEADTVALSLAAGLMVDFSLVGGSMSVDKAKMARVYGTTVTAAQVATGAVAPPLELAALYARLNSLESRSRMSPSRVSESLERMTAGYSPGRAQEEPGPSGPGAAGAPPTPAAGQAYGAREGMAGSSAAGALEPGARVVQQGARVAAEPLGPPAAYAALPSAAARRQARAPAAAGGAADAAEAAEQEAWERGVTRALTLAYMAAQNRSLLATQCLVETVVEMYRQGVTPDDLRVLVTLTSLMVPGRLMNELQARRGAAHRTEDILVTWATVVMKTLATVGVPLYRDPRKRRGAAPAAEDASPMSLGLQGLSTVQRYLEGTDLQRLQLMQSFETGQSEGDAEAQGPSPAIRILQQNSRLVLLTLDQVQDSGLPTDFPLATPSTVDYYSDTESYHAEELQAAEAQQAGSSGRDTHHHGAGPHLAVGYLSAFVGVPGAAGVAAASNAEAGAAAGGAAAGGGAESEAELVRRRAAALRLLIGFIGAASGISYAAEDFVDTAAECYSQGWSAEEVFTMLRVQEFEQSGGLVPIGLAQPPGGRNISAALFARWISICYVTLAQLGARFPGSTSRVGWAWVALASGRGGGEQGSASSMDGEDDAGVPPGLEAHGVADFVAHTLSLEDERERQQVGAAAAPAPAHQAGAPPGDASAPAAVAGVLALPKLATQRDATAAASDAAAAQPSPGFLSMEDPHLARTSPTALLFSQQIELVRMARRRRQLWLALQQA
eukprot:scaffold4.g5042.t1